MNENFAIDRFEEDFAVLEDERCKFVSIKKSVLPADAKEGDVLIKQGERYIISKGITDKLREKNINLQNSLWQEQSDI